VGLFVWLEESGTAGQTLPIVGVLARLSAPTRAAILVDYVVTTMKAEDAEHPPPYSRT
jgi:hypothetical protein